MNKCKLCKNEIDDHGTLFCSKCREKSVWKRFKVIVALEKGRSWGKAWKANYTLKERNGRSYDKYYWNRRREQ